MDKISWWRTSFGQAEINALSESIYKEHISQGPITELFETKLSEQLNVPYVVATTSGSVALLMAMIALEIGYGDEVIIPSRTWIATANAPLILGAKVALVDVQEDLPLLNTSLIESRITPKTKAIIPVHLNGRSVDMTDIIRLAKSYKLHIVEDACQALFSRTTQEYMGCLSDIGCFSLGVTKLISTGQGGFVVTHDKNIYEKLLLVRNNGVPETFDPTYTTLGCNFKFTDLLASMGLAQLNKLSDKLSHVARLYEKYEKAIIENGLRSVKLLPVKLSLGEIPLYVEILSDKRNELMGFLDSRGIQTRPFLPNLELAPYMDHKNDFKNARKFETRGLFLPSGPDQPLDNVDIVIQAIKDFESDL